MNGGAWFCPLWEDVLVMSKTGYTELYGPGKNLLYQ